MAKQQFNRLIWLVDTIYRSGRITFSEINRRWRAGDAMRTDIPLRTFHNHRQAIEEMFDINIECDKRTNTYYIADAEGMLGNKLKMWLLNSFSLNSILQENMDMKNRIVFEEAPLGLQHMDVVIDAMRTGHVLRLEYQAYTWEHSKEVVLEPYFLKLFRHRWYLIGINRSYDAFRSYSLDRIKSLSVGEENFRFLSSGVVRNPDYTMERLVRVAKDLREVHRFNGYIHLKSIPGASRELVNEAGRYADRLSVNVEIPKEENLKLLAPEKDHKSVFAPMLYIQQGVLESSEERKKFRHAPRFAPAGQSTQMIVGATAETDKDILFLSSALYQRPTMKRVYYSGYVSVNTYDTRLPALKQPPLVRENRLYQADWLMRFYQFKVDEIVDDTYPDLDLEIDPKLSWALRHPEKFPIDINRADYELILRVPGIGVKSAKLIIASRRYSKLGYYQLKKIGVVMKKAQYFITCSELPMKTVNEMTPQAVRSLLLPKPKKKIDENQLILNFKE